MYDMEGQVNALRSEIASLRAEISDMQLAGAVAPVPGVDGGLGGRGEGQGQQEAAQETDRIASDHGGFP